MAIGHVVPGAQHKRTGGVPQKKIPHTCCLLLCGRGIEVETPPLRCRLLCGRGIEAQTTPPHEKNTHSALCYVCCVLPPTVPLDCMWRVLRVLRVLGVASGSASGEPKSACSVLCKHSALQKCHFPRIFGRVHSPWRTVQQISCMESGQAKLN